MLTRLSGRYGQRGVWLVLVGTVYLVFGIGLFVEPAPTQSWVLYQYLPDWLEAVLWWLTGCVAIGQGLRGKDHDDWLGHVALYLGPASRVVSFSLAWVLHLGSQAAIGLSLTDQHIGYDRGWYAASIWLIVSAMLALASSWPNPQLPIPRPPAAALSDA